MGGSFGSGGLPKLLVLLLALTWLTSTTVEGLKCYKCKNEKKCKVKGEPIECGASKDKDSLENKNHVYWCSIITQDSDKQVHLRRCSSEVAPDKVNDHCQPWEGDNSKGPNTECFCKGELCNWELQAGQASDSSSYGKSGSSSNSKNPQTLISLLAAAAVTVTVFVTKLGAGVGVLQADLGLGL